MVVAFEKMMSPGSLSITASVKHQLSKPGPHCEHVIAGALAKCCYSARRPGEPVLVNKKVLLLQQVGEFEHKKEFQMLGVPEFSSPLLML